MSYVGEALKGFALGILITGSFFPQAVGNWLQKVDNARYQDVIDQ